MIDIPGAFLHAGNKDYVIMHMNGTLEELKEKTDPNMYGKYLTDKKERRCCIYASKKPSTRRPKWHDFERK